MKPLTQRKAKMMLRRRCHFCRRWTPRLVRLPNLTFDIPCCRRCDADRG